MEQYRTLVRKVLQQGTVTDNRTDVYSLSSVGHHHTISLANGFPLVTTTDLGGAEWDSLQREFLWYLNGQSGSPDSSEHTSIRHPRTTEKSPLETTQGRMWRQYPIAQERNPTAEESWAKPDADWVNPAHEGSQTPPETDSQDHNSTQTADTPTRDDPPESSVTTSANSTRDADTAHQGPTDQPHTLDQLRYVVETLRESPASRQAVMSAWHPGNSTASTLPPCDLMAVFNITNNRLHCHLTQRSGDVAVSVPLSIAVYALLTRLVRNDLNRTRDPDTYLAPGELSQTIVDTHIYCGEWARASWYRDNHSIIRSSLDQPRPTRQTYAALQDHVTGELPTQSGRQTDHVPGLLEQLSRDPYSRPRLTVDCDRVEQVSFADISLHAYDSHQAIQFATLE